jgi:hypothetical protein
VKRQILLSSVCCSLLFTGCGSTVQTRYSLPAPATIRQRAQAAQIVDAAANRFNFTDQTTGILKIAPHLPEKWFRAYYMQPDCHSKPVRLHANSQEDTSDIVLFQGGRTKSPDFIEVETAVRTSILRIEPRTTITSDVLLNPL